MDNDPGVSLFQGNEGIQLNSSIQQQEEEEAIEDERRRNEEIKNLLSTAFDDLSMDDDEDDRTTVNSSFHSNGYESNKSSIYENQPNDCDNTNLGNRVYEHFNDTKENDAIITNKTNYANVIVTENNNHPALRSILKNSINYGHDNSYESNSKDGSYHSSSKKQRNQFTLPRSIDSGGGGRIENIDAANHNGDNGGNEKRPLSPHHSHCYRRTSVEGKNDSSEVLSSNNSLETRAEKEQKEAYMATRYNSVEQLQLLYDIRLKEIQSLKDQLDNEHKKSTALKDDLSRKLMLAEADKEGALLSYKQSSELLAWSKGKISDLEREVATLKQNIVNLEKSRSENIKELETARGMITELQQKLAFLERSDGTRQTERQFENTIKTLENKHLKEITCLNQKLDSNNLKLKQKDDEIRSLEERLLDLQGKMGSVMVEKSETVTALMRDLEESQSQCRQLMASNIATDNVRLQQKLDDLLKEKEENNKLIASLRTECSMLKADLEQLESVSRLGLSPVSESDSMVQLGLTSKNCNMAKRCDSNLYLSDTNNKLKDELHRALLGQRAKRSEIKRLQEKLERKENQITEMKKQERMYLSEVETLKNDMGKLTGELRSRSKNFRNVERKDVCIQTPNEFIDLELENERKRINEIENEKERLKQQLKDTERLLQETRDKLAVIDKKNYDMEEELSKIVKSQVESKEIDFRIRLEEKNKECDELKELYIQLRSSKDAVCKKLEYEKDINNNLNTDIKTLKTQINDCNNKIRMKDELISKYKIDIERFEIELNELKNNGSPNNIVKEKEKECSRLREELKSATKHHSSELEGLRKELNTAKDRVIQLEKKLRAEFTNEMYKYQTEISSLQSIIKDKDLCLKELMDKLNIYSGVIKVDKNTLTESFRGVEEKVMKDNECELLELKEKHSKELQSCKDEATERIISMEKIHKEALDTIVSKTREEINKAEERQNKIIFALKKQLIEQEESLKAKYIADLALAEKKVKDITVKYFADEIKKIESRHRLELELLEKQIRSSTPVSKLEKILTEKNEEIEKLECYKSKYLEAEDKINALAKLIDTDRNATAELMTRWAKEVQDLHKQMSEKQMIITEMKEKLKKVKKVALHFRQELKTYKQKTASEMKRHQYELLQELQDKIQQAFEIDNKNELKEFEEKFSLKETELRRKLNL